MRRSSATCTTDPRAGMAAIRPWEGLRVLPGGYGGQRCVVAPISSFFRSGRGVASGDLPDLPDFARVAGLIVDIVCPGRGFVAGGGNARDQRGGGHGVNAGGHYRAKR